MKNISAAKTELSNTYQTVSEIAYSLGFEHVPSFSNYLNKKPGEVSKNCLKAGLKK
ncbi:hypothetical protein RG47T_5116 [Mucilaginibacter polytrichastri]|uniref:HTH araC/xylS-type domain-containing protein n=1 Tax=Mucilaginibacter polytrichastri TaxID=1302689 RepID=A0A1Q6A6J2_9SPHI|nr:hypothetical protein RG47T_5116 [Mucilaginibacter polytrichastri]